MLIRTIAGLTFEVLSPHQYRLVHADPRFPEHEVWMLFDGETWWLSAFVGANRHDRAFKNRNEIVSLLTSRRMAG